MANTTHIEKASYVQTMFTRIAGRYDFMNTLMTLGQDVRWRQEVIRRAALPPGGYLLDLGAGTGDLAGEAIRQFPDCRAVAADFTLEMMRVGKRRPSGGLPLWSAADALRIPFPSDTFDTIVSGFLMRNVSDVEQCLQEQYRVLKPGGNVVMLDTTRPSKNLFSLLIDFHLHTFIPLLGQWISGDSEAYRYLPESTENFLDAEKLAAALFRAGFQEIAFRRIMFGTIALHWGTK